MELSLTLMLWAFCVLAVMRTAVLVAVEEGPGSVFARLRGAVSQKTWVGRGLRCVWCVSFWASLCWSVLTFAVFDLDVRLFLWWWWSTAGAALIVYRWVGDE